MESVETSRSKSDESETLKLKLAKLEASVRQLFSSKCLSFSLTICFFFFPILFPSVARANGTIQSPRVSVDNAVEE